MNKRTHLFALVDSSFNVLTEFEYDRYFPLYGFSTPVRRNGYWGVVSKRGEVLVDFKYLNEPFIFEDEHLNIDFFLFEKKNKVGVFDDNGFLIIPFIWKRIVYCNYGIFQMENESGNFYLYYNKKKKNLSIKNIGIYSF